MLLYRGARRRRGTQRKRKEKGRKEKRTTLAEALALAEDNIGVVGGHDALARRVVARSDVGVERGGLGQATLDAVRQERGAVHMLEFAR